MKKAIIPLLFLPLCACGPKEIGEGYASDSGYVESRAPASEQMRQPIYGQANIQHRLYYYNRPDIMENMQNWRLSQYKKRMGIAPDPESPEYREVPRQRSPFRQ